MCPAPLRQYCRSQRSAAYDVAMALNELTRQEILRAIEEYDQLGRDAFLKKYGFGPARSYLLHHDGKTFEKDFGMSSSPSRNDGTSHF